MGLEQFVTKLLNVKESDLQELITLEKSDESLEIKLRLKPRPGFRNLWPDPDYFVLQPAFGYV